MSSRIKKLLGGGSLLTLPGLLKAIGLGMVVLIVCVVIIAVAIVLLLKRLADIPPVDRERQITHAPMSNGDEFWRWYTNNGCPDPPSHTYVQGVDQVPMNPYYPVPFTNSNGTVENYFEMVIVAPPVPHDVLVCMRLGGGWTNLGTVGEGTNTTGLTNQDLEVWSAAGEWHAKPTQYALTNYSSMFWTARPK